MKNTFKLLIVFSLPIIGILNIEKNELISELNNSNELLFTKNRIIKYPGYSSTVMGKNKAIKVQYIVNHGEKYIINLVEYCLFQDNQVCCFFCIVKRIFNNAKRLIDK